MRFWRAEALLQKPPLDLPNWGGGVDIRVGVDKKLGRFGEVVFWGLINAKRVDKRHLGVDKRGSRVDKCGGLIKVGRG